MYTLDKKYLIKMGRTQASGPDTTVNNIVRALTALGNPKGSSFQEIKKYVLAKEEMNLKLGLSRALKRNMISSEGKNRWSLGTRRQPINLGIMQTKCAPKKKTAPKAKAPKSKNVAKGCVCPPKGVSRKKKAVPKIKSVAPQKKKAASNKATKTCAPVLNKRAPAKKALAKKSSAKKATGNKSNKGKWVHVKAHIRRFPKRRTTIKVKLTKDDKPKCSSSFLQSLYY